MRKRRNIAFFCAFIIILTVVLPSCGDSRADAVLHGKDDAFAISYSDSLFDISIKSPQGFVYDVQNDVFVFTKGEDKVLYPGSTTKLLTALFALSVLPADTVVTAGDELDFVKSGSSIAYIKKGHSLTVEMLVQAMLLPSGNDAAYVLSAAVGRAISRNDDMSASGAIAAFISAVNDYAENIGLCGTVITVPDGYAAAEHFTTTEDMAIIARLASENEIISRYASMAEADVVYASGQTNSWVNTNLLLDEKSGYYSPRATGLKTGSVSGEYSLVFSFSFEDGREYIAGVFGADEKNTRFSDACAIINYFEDLVLT